jgi:hypothetical protein
LPRKKVPTKFLSIRYPLIFAPQIQDMDYRQAEYHEELQKVQDRDFTHNWVSSSAFLFYLSIACLIAFAFGTCYKLYTKDFDASRPEKVTIQESTKFTPQYK